MSGAMGVLQTRTNLQDGTGVGDLPQGGWHLLVHLCPALLAASRVQPQCPVLPASEALRPPLPVLTCCLCLAWFWESDSPHFHRDSQGACHLWSDGRTPELARAAA